MTTRMDGGRAVVEALRAHGVSKVFGVVGSTLFSVYDALYDDPQISLITPRGEDGAGHMADAYARVSGDVGVCLFTVGAGAAYGLSAIGEAFADSIPVLVICTQIPAGYLDRNKGVYHESQDQMAMFKPVTGWCHRVTRAADIPEAIREAFRRMRSGRPRPVMLEIPADVLGAECDAPILPPAPVAEVAVDDAQVRAAADLLRAAKNPVIWAGGGVVRAQAGAELQELAELLQAPVLGTSTSKGILPDDYPLMLGNILTQSPLIETQALNAADVMLALGTRFSERATRSTDSSASRDAIGRSTEGWTVRIPANLIHVDIDPGEFGKNYPPKLAVQADARVFLRRLLDALRAGGCAPRKSKAARFKKLKSAARADIKMRFPEEIELLEKLRRAIPREAIVSAQSIPGHWARFAFEMYLPANFLFAYSFGSMGYAFHAAIGAKLAFPERPVIALCGDGGFVFGCGEMATIAHYKLPIPVVIFNNHGFKILQTSQKRRYGRVVGTDLTNPDFIQLGKSFGFRTQRVRTLSALGSSIRKAFAADGPTLIEAVIDFTAREFSV